MDVAARGVRPVEIVTDPRSSALATAEGAIVGGGLGLVAALFPIDALAPALAGLAGVVAGAALGAFAHAAVG